MMHGLLGSQSNLRSIGVNEKVRAWLFCHRCAQGKSERELFVYVLISRCGYPGYREMCVRLCRLFSERDSAGFGEFLLVKGITSSSFSAWFPEIVGVSQSNFFFFSFQYFQQLYTVRFFTRGPFGLGPPLRFDCIFCASHRPNTYRPYFVNTMLYMSFRCCLCFISLVSRQLAQYRVFVCICVSVYVCACAGCC